MARGIRRKELKEPDEFLTLSRRFIDYARSHERELTIAVAALAAVLLLALGVRWYRSSQEAKAETAFGAARREFVARKFDTAGEAFARVTSSWPSTRHGELAFVYLGNCYAELGKTKEAEAAFENALRHSRDPLVEQIAHYNLGVLKLKAGDKDGAGKELGAATATEGPLRGVAWFSRLGTDKFVEDVSLGMQAIGELGQPAREYVEAQIASRAKSGK